MGILRIREVIDNEKLQMKKRHTKSGLSCVHIPICMRHDISITLDGFEFF